MAGHKNSALDELLRSHAAVKGEAFTHTRIGDKEQNIFGGSYNIPDEEQSDFMKKYYHQVFVQGKKEYLTEKQLIENGPLLIDMDFRYPTTITTRQHTEEHVLDAVMIYAEKIKEIVDLTDKAVLEVFVMEKKDVNRMDDKTKDGIHIIFGIQMHKGLQVLLRNSVLPDLKELWDDLPLTNGMEDVLDEGVTKGFVNWQQYGSRKPGHQAYMVKYHYTLEHDTEWSVTKHNLATFSTEKNMERLSARYTGFPKFEMKESVKEQFERAKESLNRQQRSGADKPSAARSKYKLKTVGGGLNMNYSDISSEEVLDLMLEELFDEVGSSNYRIKETHQYTMTLPAWYYGPGSYNKWVRVGWALAYTSPKLFLSWLKFSSQENCRDSLKGPNGKFDWRNVKDLYEMWCTFNNSSDHCLTYRSIIYWSKNDAREKYNAINKETVDYFIEQSINTPTDYDLANVLFHMHKEEYVCSSISRNCWHKFDNHRWYESDSATELRRSISTTMYKDYFSKMSEVLNKMQLINNDQSTQEYDILKKKQTKLSKICMDLKSNACKNKILCEAKELFYDANFIQKLDQNPKLLCFNNYVIDFNTKTHRRGQSDDYISKCTGIDYIPYDVVQSKHMLTVTEVNQFMKQLFPDPKLCAYMWDHLASCLIGTNNNQTFNIYKGSGRNGKSKLVELMGRGLGTYKGTVPITLITQKRNTIGSTSSEVAQLMGVRYAVMQEPSKGDKINEGIMKEITGGDPIQARALFKDTITFIPQFKLAVCTNTDFEGTSNDDGTWRRMRYVDFVSKMLEKPYEDPKFPKTEFPYQFPLDKNLDKKFDTWAPVFMSLLVEKAYVLQGVVNDCDVVLASSDKHRESQDYMAEFTKDKIKTAANSRIKKTEVLETFKQWYNSNYGKNVPKGKEVFEFMNQRFGEYKNGWHNVAIIYDEEEDKLIEEL